MRKMLSALVLLVLSLLSVSLVSAANLDNLEVTSVKVNDEDATVLPDATNATPLTGVAPTVEEGEMVEVEVALFADATVKDVRVEAELSGYEFDDDDVLSDRSAVFDMNVAAGDAGTTKKVTLELQLPRRLENDRYLLRLRVTDKDSVDMTRYVVLQVEAPRRGLDIADVVLSPGTTVKAGRTLLATVLLENFGSRQVKDVKVTVAVPALGVSATEFVDEVETDDGNVEYEDVSEMFLPLPATAAEGDYEVVVTASSDRTSTVSKTLTLHVLADERFQEQEDKLVLAVGPESQSVFAGSTVRYALALTNAGSQSKAYLLATAAGDWATASLSEQLIVLEPGKNKIVYVDVTAADSAASGQHTVPVTVSADGEALETVNLAATVSEKTSEQPANAAAANLNLRTGLEVALIVLVVVLVIVGLILGFSRLRKDNDGEEKTYY